MTTEQIQSKLIDHYSLAIERVKGAGTFGEARAITTGMAVHCGVCNCAYSFYDTDIFEAEWATKNMGKPYPHSVLGKWGDFPYAATTKEEILSRLQLRLDILKKEYSLSIETIKPSSV